MSTTLNEVMNEVQGTILPVTAIGCGILMAILNFLFFLAGTGRIERYSAFRDKKFKFLRFTVNLVAVWC